MRLHGFSARRLTASTARRRETDRIITDKSTAELEIILGDTSRAKSKKAAAGLGEFDWVYDVQTKKSIVINAGDSAGLYEAVSAFLWDSFGYVNKYNRLGSYVKWTGSEYVTVEATKNVNVGNAPSLFA